MTVPAAGRLEGGPAPPLQADHYAALRFPARSRRAASSCWQPWPLLLPGVAEPRLLGNLTEVAEVWPSSIPPRPSPAPPPQWGAPQGHVLACDKWHTSWKGNVGLHFISHPLNVDNVALCALGNSVSGCYRHDFDDQNIRILGLSHALGISWPHRFYTSMESYSFSSCNSEWLNPPCKKCWNRLLWDQLSIIWSICCMWIRKFSKTRTLENIYYRDYTLCKRGYFLELIKWLFKEGRAMSHVFLILILCRLCESTSLSPLNHVGSFIHVQSAYRISDTMLSLEGEQRWVKCAHCSGSCDWSEIRRLHLSRTRARTRLETRGVRLGRRTGS